MANWIKCSERMPEKYVDVLVCDSKLNVFISHQRYGYWRDLRVGESRFEVTHWMPLPEPPQE